MITKIFITGSSKINKIDFAKKLTEINDDFSISQTFTNDPDYKNKEHNDYMFYLNSKDIDLSYKNNAFLFITGNDTLYTGITIDSFYNEDIFCMDINEFNNIPNYIFSSNDIVVVWLDTKVNGIEKSNIKDIMDSKYLLENIDNFNVLYFLDEDPEYVANTVLSYVCGDEKERQRILEENY